jgi:hypothetical protein
VLAVASISHSGAIASIRLTILKEVVCFLGTEIGDFIRAASRNFLQWEGSGGAAEENGGDWLLASRKRAMRTSAFRVRYAQREKYYSSRVNLAAFVLVVAAKLKCLTGYKVEVSKFNSSHRFQFAREKLTVGHVSEKPGYF